MFQGKTQKQILESVGVAALSIIAFAFLVVFCYSVYQMVATVFGPMNPVAVVVGVALIMAVLSVAVGLLVGGIGNYINPDPSRPRHARQR